jgi:hypothetical protein
MSVVEKLIKYYEKRYNDVVRIGTEPEIPDYHALQMIKDADIYSVVLSSLRSMELQEAKEHIKLQLNQEVCITASTIRTYSGILLLLKWAIWWEENPTEKMPFHLQETLHGC